MPSPASSESRANIGNEARTSSAVAMNPQASCHRSVCALPETSIRGLNGARRDGHAERLHQLLRGALERSRRGEARLGNVGERERAHRRETERAAKTADEQQRENRTGGPRLRHRRTDVEHGGERDAARAQHRAYGKVLQRERGHRPHAKRAERARKGHESARRRAIAEPRLQRQRHEKRQCAGTRARDCPPRSRRGTSEWKAARSRWPDSASFGNARPSP